MLMETDDLMEDFFTIRLSNQNSTCKNEKWYTFVVTYILLLLNT